AEQIESLRVLDAVVAESLRLLPTGLWGQRDATEDTHIGPCAVKRGTRVIYSTLVTQRLPEIYPEPYRFRPERWFDDAPPPYAYLAFGAGPRLCIGRALALVETKLVLAVLLQRYRLSFRAGTHIDRYSFSAAAGSPLPMVVHGQDGEFGREWIQGNIHYLVDLG
ncbi:MAG: cytochrome P450, partial [Gemmatimonadetes bacterium]|nr:cytochrome P450 [Gemmatimonadota bacterium]